MINKVIRFEASDGSLHLTEAQAEAHNQTLTLRALERTVAAIVQSYVEVNHFRILVNGAFNTPEVYDFTQDVAEMIIAAWADLKAAIEAKADVQ